MFPLGPSLLFPALTTLLSGPGIAAEPPPLKVLLVTGGGFHDYEAQKEILKAGLERRANVRVDLAHVAVQGNDLKPALPIFGRSDYARGYDVVIHDECAAGVDDPAVIDGVLAPHREGIPAVVLHCGVHSYRIGDPSIVVDGPGGPRARWFDLVGIQSSGHGPQLPIAVTYVAPDSPITKGLADWTTIPEELYNNVKVFPAVHPLARGRQAQAEAIVAWTHSYGSRNTRVFCTTLGHNNATVTDPRYLDLVTRGVLWAAGKLEADGQPSAGYQPRH